MIWLSISERLERSVAPAVWTVETEVNGESKRTNERSSFVVGLSGLYSAGTRDFYSALAGLVGPVQNIFFLTVHYFSSFVPIAQQAGQVAVLGRLSFSVCLWSLSGKLESRIARKLKAVPV
jgi:hypothetical protein